MNLLNLSDLNTKRIGLLISRAKDMKNGNIEPFADGKFITNLFYEPSTRTRLSFEIAQKKLGFNVIDLDNKTSSIQKGESFYDTLKTLESIGVDGVVVRHTDPSCFDDINNINIPIINAGNGTANHPTQALTDLMTIIEEFGSVSGLNISIIGDVKHSRVANDNIDSLKRFGANVNLVTPFYLEEDGIEYISMREAVEKSDVIMLLRNQIERYPKEYIYSRIKEGYVDEQQKSLMLTPELVSKMKKTSIIMHPAPFNRGVEIHSDVVECSKSRIFKQMENGIFTRMAVLESIFK